MGHLSSHRLSRVYASLESTLLLPRQAYFSLHFWNALPRALLPAAAPCNVSIVDALQLVVVAWCKRDLSGKERQVRNTCMSSAVDRTVISFLRLFFKYVNGVSYFYKRRRYVTSSPTHSRGVVLSNPGTAQDIPPCTLELEVASR